jgi:Insertion element 4 transposase N-terminal/Transposase DDE domain
MPRTVAGLPAGTRVTDYVSLGVIAQKIPQSVVREVLRQEGKESQRQRQLPAHVVVYYVIALALYMGVSYAEVLRCLVEALRWLGLPVERIRQTGRSGISQARSRLGAAPMRRLFESVAEPVAVPETRGAWYQRWRLVSLDGTTLDVADEKVNEEAFGRPGASRGFSSFPQLRLTVLAECGTHVVFAAADGPSSTGEKALARQLIGQLQGGMLCIADRSFLSYELWNEAASSGADLLWRINSKVATTCDRRLSDGSYLSRIYRSTKDRRQDHEPTIVRVIEYTLEGVENTEFIYRLATTILDESQAPAVQLATLYTQRWEVEGVFDELKSHLRGPRVVLRSKTPDLVRQELYGLLLAHFAVRALMHEAALRAELDPDTLSFTHSVRVIRRHAITAAAFPPSDPATHD